MIGSPFTVGLSLPVRLDYQYQFLEQSEIDEGRMILETSERNIVFRSFENKKCQGVLQYLVRVNLMIFSLNCHPCNCILELQIVMLCSVFYFQVSKKCLEKNKFFRRTNR